MRTLQDSCEPALSCIGRHLPHNYTLLVNFHTCSKHIIELVKGNPEFNTVINDIKDYVSFCRFENVAFDLIFGKSEDSSVVTVNIMIAICTFSGVAGLLYIISGVLGCIFMKEIKSYGWSA